MQFDATHPDVIDAIKRALAEDIGSGDITANSIVPSGLRAEGRFIARQPIVVAGTELLPLILETLGAIDEIKILKHSGERAADGETVAWVSGWARPLLTGERVSLNFLQRLSGIATLTRRYVDSIAHTNCRVLDTRKTTPGLRVLEKMATSAGGATNHRMGLFDAVLIKNNHIAIAGSVTAAIERARSAAMPIEVEVRTRPEIDEALAAGASRILLDNMTPEQAAVEVRYIAGRASIEISGGITLETVRAYAETGADFVSSGALTHSATAVDLNFRLEPA